MYIAHLAKAGVISGYITRLYSGQSILDLIEITLACQSGSLNGVGGNFQVAAK
jgi:hypothetical protein